MSYKRGWIKKFINGVSTKVFAFAHVKTVYKDYENDITLDDVLIETEDYDQSAVTESEISPVILSKINEVATQSASNFTLLNANKAESAETYTRAEVDNLISALKQECDWKESIETFNDLSTTYPDAEEGWTVTVKDTNTIYRFNGTEWVDIYSLIMLATESNDGLMSKSDFTKLSGIEEGANKYVHPGSGTNPHGTTASDIGLGNADDTRDIDKPISTAQQEKFDEIENEVKTQFPTAAGSNITINDPADGKIRDIKLYGKSEQFQGEIELEDGTTVTVPCPDYPQEIKSVVNPSVKLWGKNLFDNSILVKNGACTFSNDEITIINTNRLAITNVPLSVKAGNNITISYYVKGVKEQSFIVSLLYTNGSKKELYTSINASEFIYNKETVSLTKDLESISFGGTGGLALGTIVKKMQIELGSVATNYEPYTETTATFPYTLNAIPVESGGNVTIDGQEYIADYVDIERKKLVRMVYGGRMYGTTNGWSWLLRDNKLEYYAVEHPYFNKFKNVLDTIAVSNSFSSGANWGGNSKNKIGVSNSHNAYIFIGASSFDSLDDLTSYLDDNEVYVYSLLETPTETDLTDEEVQEFKELQTYSPYTNVFVTSEQLDGYTEFEYPATDVAGMAINNASDIEDLTNTITKHNENTDIHITAEERTAWNNANSYKTEETVIGTFRGDANLLRKMYWGTYDDFDSNELLKIYIPNTINFITRISAIYTEEHYDSERRLIRRVYDMTKDMDNIIEGQQDDNKIVFHRPQDISRSDINAGYYTITIEYAIT